MRKKKHQRGGAAFLNMMGKAGNFLVNTTKTAAGAAAGAAANMVPNEEAAPSIDYKAKYEEYQRKIKMIKEIIVDAEEETPTTVEPENTNKDTSPDASVTSDEEDEEDGEQEVSPPTDLTGGGRKKRSRKKHRRRRRKKRSRKVV